MPQNRTVYYMISLKRTYILSRSLEKLAMALQNQQTTQSDQSIRCFLHTGYLRFYPGIENHILPMLSYPSCRVRATYIGCIGTSAHSRLVTSLLC